MNLFARFRRPPPEPARPALADMDDDMLAKEIHGAAFHLNVLLRAAAVRGTMPAVRVIDVDRPGVGRVPAVDVNLTRRMK